MIFRDESADELPSAEVQRVARQWGVTVTERTHTRYSQTWFGVRGGEHVVLKVGSAPSRRREAVTLRAYAAGSARLADLAGATRAEPSPSAASQQPVACRLLAEARGALLLERILLGDDIRPLAAEDDDVATATAGAIFVQMHGAVAAQPRPPELPELRGLATMFADYWQRPDATSSGAPLPVGLVAHAQDLLRDLTLPAASDIVLHGDAHHQNLIRHGSGGPDDIWRVIDPQGWWGDSTFDAVALMLNLHGSLAMSQRSHDELRAQARRRADILSDSAGFDRARLLAWTFTGAVMAELRCLHDHGFVQGGPRNLAEALASEV